MRDGVANRHSEPLTQVMPWTFAEEGRTTLRQFEPLLLPNAERLRQPPGAIT